jgi:hypothetical protein
MFGGPNRQIAPKFHVNDQELRIRPYNAALNQLTGKICNEIGMGDSDICLFETRVAFDCILRNKVQKFGSVTDNVGLCSIHINNMKKNIEQSSAARSDFSSVIDNYLDEVNYMTKSFV